MKRAEEYETGERIRVKETCRHREFRGREGEVRSTDDPRVLPYGQLVVILDEDDGRECFLYATDVETVPKRSTDR